jgi:KDO2-lipid IV(A) lauroyltransferase
VKAIIDFFITQTLLFVGLISSHISISKRNKLGCFIGNIFKFISPERKKIAFENLKMAFPSESGNWINNTVKKSYHNLGIIVTEVAAMRSISEENLKNMIKFNNLDLLIDKYKEGRGLILLSGHFANWEILAYSAGLFAEIPILIIVKPQKNSSSDKIINKYRTRSGNRVISMHNAAREIIKNIQDGGAIALLADQSATSDKDIYVEFFGKSTATYKAPAEIALKFNVPVICSFPVRQKDFTYIAEIQELKHDDLENNENGVIEFTKRYAKMLEEAIKINPELWVWQHRRWKHTV